MKILFIISQFICVLSFGQTPLSLQLNNESIRFKATNGQTISFRSARLNYKGSDGGIVSTDDSYLIEMIDDYPRIVDMLQGHSVKLRLMDIGEHSGNEVLAFYFSGGNQYAVSVYILDGINVRPVKTQPGSSNMRSIEVDGKNLIVKNELNDTNSTRKIVTDTYRLVGNDCKLVQEVSERINK